MIDSARGSLVEVYAQNIASGVRGATRARSRRRCCASWTCAALVLGHSERARCSARPNRALALKVPAALEAGLAPILCVGETEEERDNGETDRKLRQQGARRPRAGCPASAWGSGDRLRARMGDRHRQSGHGGQAQERDRIHPRAGWRPRQGRRRAGADPVRRLGQPGTQRSCWRLRTWTVRWSARVADAPAFAGSWPAAASVSARFDERAAWRSEYCRRGRGSARRRCAA